MIWEGFQGQSGDVFYLQSRHSLTYLLNIWTEYSYDVHPNNYPGGVVMDKAILNYAYREAF